MKKLLGIVAISLTLTGCSSPVPEAKPEQEVVSSAYGLPADCEIKELLALDTSFQAIDQTEGVAKNARNCIVGTPNSDVGIWFDFKVVDQAEWDGIVANDLKPEGYQSFEAGIEGVEVWRAQVGSEEEGITCTMQGRMGGIAFTIMEPWVECEDKWNKDLVGYVVDHAAIEY